VCSPPATDAFVKQVRSGELVLLPKVGHGYSVPRNWMPQFRAAFVRVLEKSGPPPAPAAPAVADLPLVEAPAAGDGGDVMAVIVSGDGGWASIDRKIGESLAARGVPVVGLNSLQYFWKPRTPDGLAADLTRILRHYMPLWRKPRVLLVGYSFGADVLPFAARRLPADLLAAVSQIALLGAEGRAHFEFHLSDWLDGHSADDQPVLPELAPLRGKRILCFYGADEKDSFCPRAPADLVEKIELRGSHHFGGDYQPILDALAPAQKAAPPEP
jgi:type IV secretory pathway VirJ component